MEAMSVKFQKAAKTPQPVLPSPTAIASRGEPFSQAQIIAALGRYRFRNGFEPRDGKMPVGRKVSKQQQD